MQHRQPCAGRDHQCCPDRHRAALAPDIGVAGDAQRRDQFARTEDERDARDACRREPELVLQPAAERDDQRMAGSGQRKPRQQHEPAARDQPAGDACCSGGAMLDRLRLDPTDDHDRHHGHRRRAAEIPDSPVRRSGDQPHRADPDQQPERPRHLDQADHPAAALVRHVVSDPCADSQVERRVALADQHKGNRQHRHPLARRGKARSGDSRAHADGDRTSSAETIDDVPDRRRGQAEQLGYGNCQTDVGQLHVEPAGDRGDERPDEPVAGVGRHPRGRERCDVATHLRRVGIIQHSAEHDARR